MAQQPPWSPPPLPRSDVRSRLPPLHIYNSLTRSKVPFTPLDPEGRKVTWYSCGPTVYDDSHLGHARNYVTIDVIRRVLVDYFGFEVEFVMNITDIDDKIILAARQEWLLRRWLAKHKEVDEDVRKTTKDAFDAYLAKNLPLLGEGTSPETFAEESEKAYGHVIAGKSLANDSTPPSDKETKIKMHLNIARQAASALLTPTSDTDLPAFSAKAAAVLRPYIDSLESTTVKGSDHHIFTELTKHYEQHFFEDMHALNVRDPDRLTRATEYCGKIVDYVKRIEENGFAYDHDGSVYYDIGGWKARGGEYARLEPWSWNDKELQADGEGSLSTQKTGFKRSGADFALWKASRTGEPSWPSPWGEGRPGWHIECSAMASDTLGKNIDLHSGGIDLAFPHHDNELAQAEAYYNNGEQWVNYFLHMGHLSIQGSKMSKSLKNFTTIREALGTHGWTSRGLRIVFLLGSWKDGLEITDELRKAAMGWEERVTNLFIRIRDAQQRDIDVQTNGPASAAATNGANGTSIVDLTQKLEQSRTKFGEALADSFDTPTAMRVISDIITAFNSEKHVPQNATKEVGLWITDMVLLLGLDNDSAKRKAGQIGWSGIEIPDKAKPFIRPLAELRDNVRRQAMSGRIDLMELGRMEEVETWYPETQPYAKAYADFQRSIVALHKRGAGGKEYLEACDFVRDTVLWTLDIYLEDREGAPALIRPLSASLRQERQDKEAKAAEKAAAKEAARAKAEAEERERAERGKLSHKEMFKTAEFSAWDADGLPTKDAEGNEVAKNRSKKLRKDWERQKKLHEGWLASQSQS